MVAVPPYIYVLSSLFSMMKDSHEHSDITKDRMVWVIIQAIWHNETFSHVTDDMPEYRLV